MLLTPEQLVELTGRVRSDAQKRELQHLGIPFRERRDGSLVVTRAAVEGERAIVTGQAAAEPELMP